MAPRTHLLFRCEESEEPLQTIAAPCRGCRAALTGQRELTVVIMKLQPTLAYLSRSRPVTIPQPAERPTTCSDKVCMYRLDLSFVNKSVRRTSVVLRKVDADTDASEMLVLQVQSTHWRVWCSTPY